MEEDNVQKKEQLMDQDQSEKKELDKQNPLAQKRYGYHLLQVGKTDHALVQCLESCNGVL